MFLEEHPEKEKARENDDANTRTMAIGRDSMMTERGGESW